MRERADAERIRAFMRAAGAAAAREGVCYLTGGATAVLVGWRATTIDVDVALVPEQDELLRELPRIKNELGINVELASPQDFIPSCTGSRRSTHRPSARQSRLRRLSHSTRVKQAPVRRLEE